MYSCFFYWNNTVKSIYFNYYSSGEKSALICDNIWQSPYQYQVENDELLNNKKWDLGEWVSIYLLLNILEKSLVLIMFQEEQVILRITFSHRRCLALDFLTVWLNKPGTDFFHWLVVLLTGSVPLFLPLAFLSLRFSLLYCHFSAEISG